MDDVVEFVSYKCEICDTIYNTAELAHACAQSHQDILIRIKREDLFKLLQFIITKDDDLLSKDLVETLLKYKRGAYT